MSTLGRANLQTCHPINLPTWQTANLPTCQHASPGPPVGAPLCQHPGHGPKPVTYGHRQVLLPSNTAVNPSCTTHHILYLRETVAQPLYKLPVGPLCYDILFYAVHCAIISSGLLCYNKIRPVGPHSWRRGSPELCLPLHGY